MRYIVLIIESTSIQAIFLEKNKNQELTIVDSYQNTIAPLENITGKSLSHIMIRALDDLLERIQVKSIAHVHIVLSSPWILSKTKTSSSTFAQPINVTPEYIEDLIKEEQKEFKKVFPFDVDFVEHKVFDVFINGRPAVVKKPVPAMTISVSSTMSAVSKEVLDKINKTVHKYIRDVHISFHSASVLSYLSLRYMLPDMESGVFLNIHGEGTDIVLFAESAPIHFAYTNFGHHSLLRNLGSSANISQSKMNLYEKNHLSKSEHEKFERDIEKHMQNWRSHIHEALTKLDSTLPKEAVVYSRKNQKLFEKSLNDYNILTGLPEKIDDLYINGIRLVEFHT